MRQRIICESILDAIGVTKPKSSSAVASGSMNDAGFNHNIDICLRKLYTDKMDKSGLKVSQIRELDNILVSYVSTLALMDSFSVTFSMSPNPVVSRYEDFLPC